MARVRSTGTLLCGLSLLPACGLGLFDDQKSTNTSASHERPMDAGSESDLEWSLAADPAYLSILTYNVAGLPEGISGSNPKRNTSLISPLLNPYDVVTVQEDFSYHADLVSLVDHPYQSSPNEKAHSLGDGLNTLSRIPFHTFDRLSWTACNGTFDSGSDCLTPKGFTRARMELGQGLVLDVYDVHMDAGHASGDEQARAKNFAQLSQTIRKYSADVAVLVAGDFNERYRDPGDEMEKLLAETGLTDSWVDFVHNGVLPAANALASACDSGDPNDDGCERIDKVLFRSSSSVELMLVDYLVEGATFVDPNGAQLSDHRPVMAKFVVLPMAYSLASE
ncbi:MAG: endonuclease/exonuclease/phosphatase family protein [Myxococcales bacterium]